MVNGRIAQEVLYGVSNRIHLFPICTCNQEYRDENDSDYTLRSEKALDDANF